VKALHDEIEGRTALDDQKPSAYPLLSEIRSPQDLKELPLSSCVALAEEIRAYIVEMVTHSGGHLGSNLGAVEITLAMHRVFNSPEDVLLFDTGHQAYVHKLLTGRMQAFAGLRQEGGLSGYPSRAESIHDVIENSHASTALSYAHGIASAFASNPQDSHRRVVALVGDGALTGGMAYEAMNNLGHAGARVVIVLNDNGRSYAPTISKLSESLNKLRLNPSYGALRSRLNRMVEDLPGVGQLAGQSLKNFTSALRELIEPHVFFEALGIRYAGPIDGHDVGSLEAAMRNAATWQGPIVLHVLTRKGKGFGPAEADDVQCLHDYRAVPGFGAPGSVSDQGALAIEPSPPEKSYTEAFSKALLAEAAADPSIFAITAAMPGPTGLLGFEARYPERFIDVGIAEQHALTMAAGLGLYGKKPIVAVYSTFLSRCFDQENLDIGLHQVPVVICADRAGITGDDGPSHHGIWDMVLGLSIPSLAVFVPSEPGELKNMLSTALSLGSPALIRYPKTPGISLGVKPGSGLHARILREGSDQIVVVGIGKIAGFALAAAELLEEEGIDVTVIDPRVIRPADPALLERCVNARLVLTAEDGLVHGGAGQYLRSLIEDEAATLASHGPKVTCLGVPTTYIPQAKPDAILARLGLDAPGIAASIRKAIQLVEASDLDEAQAITAGARTLSVGTGTWGMVVR